MTSTMATCASMLAAIGFGTVAFFAKHLTDTGMAAQAVAFYRYALVAILLSPFLLVRQSERPTTLWGILSGAAMGVGWTGYVKALEVTPVATVGIIYMSYPMLTVVMAWLWFRQELTARSIIASVLVLVATVIATTPTVIGGGKAVALLLALAAPLTFAFSINILVSKLSAIPPLSRIASVALGAVLGLLPMIAPLSLERLLHVSLANWWLIGGIAVVTALVPQVLYVISAPRIGAAKTAMAGSVELPVMLLIGSLAFGETISSATLACAALIVVAVALTPARRPA